MALPSLAPYPRLHVPASSFGRLRDAPQSSFLRAAAAAVAVEAERFVAAPRVEFDASRRSPLLARAREAQRRVVTLLVRGRQTDDAQLETRCRAAALDVVRDMVRWPHWSADAMARGDRRPEADFDLACGENAATLAIAFDWLYDALDAFARAELVEAAERRAIGPFRALVADAEPARRPAWFARADTNWNPVCAGGLGLLLLAVFEHVPDAADLLDLVERSISVHVRSLERNGGGWPEGVAHWNYGQRYALNYLTAHENATGRPHPLLRSDAVRRTLRFPLDFTPGGAACGFGDARGFTPLPFHYAVAVRLGETEVVAEINRRLGPALLESTVWPDAANWLLSHDDAGPAAPRAAAPGAVAATLTHYAPMDWFALADRTPGPRVSLTVRGGSCATPGAHADLLSFHCVVGARHVIADSGETDATEAAAGPRRGELFEAGPLGKNTLLVNGLGVVTSSAVQSTTVEARGVVGVRLDATAALGRRGDDAKMPAAVRSAVRLVLVLAGGPAVVLDRVLLHAPGRAEARLHTPYPVSLDAASALVVADGETLRLAFAADVPALLLAGQTSPTRPVPGLNVLRWCTLEAAHPAITLATLLSPVDGPAALAVRGDGDTVKLVIESPLWTGTLTLPPTMDAVQLRKRPLHVPRGAPVPQPKPTPREPAPS